MRIAQITDPHITATGPGPGAAEVALAAVLARAASLDPPPDRVVFTGDLTEHGTPEEYARFRAVVAGLDLPMAAVPGNHDRRDAFVAGLAGSGVEIGAGPFLHRALEDGPVRLLCLDTLGPPDSPAGLLCEARLDWVAARLAEDDPRPVMIFMHHPPFRIGQRLADDSNCRGGDRLAAIVARQPRVLGVACGHAHLEARLAWAGTLGSICPAVATAVPLDNHPAAPLRMQPQPPAFQLHAWSPAIGLVSHTLRRPELARAVPVGRAAAGPGDSGRQAPRAGVSI